MSLMYKRGFLQKVAGTQAPGGQRNDYWEPFEWVQDFGRMFLPKDVAKAGAKVKRLKELGDLSAADAGSHLLFGAVGGKDAQKWRAENPTAANAITYLGVPSLLSLAAWGIGSIGKKKTPSFLPYWLPMALIGGGMWALGDRYKAVDLVMGGDLRPKKPAPGGKTPAPGKAPAPGGNNQGKTTAGMNPTVAPRPSYYPGS